MTAEEMSAFLDAMVKHKVKRCALGENAFHVEFFEATEPPAAEEVMPQKRPIGMELGEPTAEELLYWSTNYSPPDPTEAQKEDSAQ